MKPKGHQCPLIYPSGYIRILGKVSLYSAVACPEKRGGGGGEGTN